MRPLKFARRQKQRLHLLPRVGGRRRISVLLDIILWLKQPFQRSVGFDLRSFVLPLFAELGVVLGKSYVHGVVQSSDLVVLQPGLLRFVIAMLLRHRDFVAGHISVCVIWFFVEERSIPELATKCAYITIRAFGFLKAAFVVAVGMAAVEHMWIEHGGVEARRWFEYCAQST